MQKLFIISNESIYENNNTFFCDNIDLKSTPEGLDKNFEVSLIARKSRAKRSHKINIQNIKIFHYINHLLFFLNHLLFVSDKKLININLFLLIFINFY